MSAALATSEFYSSVFLMSVGEPHQPVDSQLLKVTQVSGDAAVFSGRVLKRPSRMARASLRGGLSGRVAAR